MMEIHLRQTNKRDIPAILDILEDARRYKQSRGDDTWGDKPFTNDEVGGLLSSDNCFLAETVRKPAGFVKTQTEDIYIWGDVGLDSKALYLHHLATSSDFRGQNVGGQMLQQLATYANSKEKKLLRLDCSVDNIELQRYYTMQGFKQVGRNNMKNYVACLFEKEV